MTKNRFESKISEVKLSDGETLKIRSLSFGELERLTPKLNNNQGLESIKLSLDFIKTVVVGWSFVDDAGNPIECIEENFRKLDMESIAEFMKVIVASFNPEKKSEMQFGE